MNSRTAVLVLAAALAAACAGREPPPFDARRPALSAPLAGRVCEVPVRIVGGVVLVPVRIHGRGPFTFAFDTGATTLVVGEHVADELDLASEDRRAVLLTEAGRTDGSVAQTQVRELRVGDAAFRRVGALVADLAPLSRGIGRRLDGILGMTVFTQHLWTLDPAASVLRVEDGALPAPDDVETFALRMDDGLPSLAVDVAGRATHAILDTGQRMALALGPEDAARLRHRLRVVGRSVGHVLDGEVEREVARVDGDVRVGPSVLRAPPALLGRATRVGLQAFPDRVLSFDFHNLRFRASPPPR